MYDYKSDPLPKHQRWQTKPARIVLAIAQLDGQRGSIGALTGLLAGFLSHFFVSNKVATILAVLTLIATQALMRVLINYYGLAAKYKIPAWKYALSIFLVLLILWWIY